MMCGAGGGSICSDKDQKAGVCPVSMDDVAEKGWIKIKEKEKGPDAANPLALWTRAAIVADVPGVTRDRPDGPFEKRCFVVAAEASQPRTDYLFDRMRRGPPASDGYCRLGVSRRSALRWPTASIRWRLRWGTQCSPLASKMHERRRKPSLVLLVDLTRSNPPSVASRSTMKEMA